MNDLEAQRPRVLIVDDEQAICRIVARSLIRNGFDATGISDPSELLALLRSEEFEVILLDRSMGATQGTSLLPSLRETAPTAKILFFTGEFVEEGEMDDVDGIIQKPINGRLLAETLRNLLLA